MDGQWAGIVVIGLLGLLVWFRWRQPGSMIGTTPPVAGAAKVSRKGDAPLTLLGGLTKQADFSEETMGVQEPDALDEADVYLLYGYLERAAPLIEAALAVDPHDARARQLATRLAELQQGGGRKRLSEPVQAAVPQALIPPPAAAEPVASTSAATSDAASVAQPLFKGGAGTVLAPYPDEVRVLSALVSPTQLARRWVRLGQPLRARQLLEARLPHVARPLPLLLELIEVSRQLGDAETHARALWQFCHELGEHGGALRQRLLQQGEVLGPHPLREALALVGDRAGLRRLGERYGLLEAPPEHQARALLTVPKAAVALAADCDDALQLAGQALDDGQPEQALALLESGVRATPQRAELYPLLLELYRRIDVGRLRSLLAELGQRGWRPPAEVAAQLAAFERQYRLQGE